MTRENNVNAIGDAMNLKQKTGDETQYNQQNIAI